MQSSKQKRKHIASFVVAGNPVPKQSFRFSKKGHFQPQRLTDWEEMVGWAAKQQAPTQPLPGTFAVVLRFYRGDKRRVDLDNLSKAVLDALNGVFWIDDTQVTTLYLFKRYDPDLPRVEVKIWYRPLRKSTSK